MEDRDSKPTAITVSRIIRERVTTNAKPRSPPNRRALLEWSEAGLKFMNVKNLSLR